MAEIGSTKSIGPLVLCLALLVAGCAGQTGLGVNLVSEQETRQMGQQAWQELRAETPLAADPAMQQRARRVADRVLQAAGEDPAGWEVAVFEGKEANAFALPGGKIGVFRGMMGFAGDDAELAAVLGHEVAHVERNHSGERLSSAMATQVGTEVAGAALQAAGLGAAAPLLGLGAQYGILLPYSRNQELEADRLGLHLMARAGYDPHAAVALWRRMDARGGEAPAFLSTHPNSGDRMQRLEAELPQALAEYRG